MGKETKHIDINNPPVWCNRFLQWYCKEELQEEILGDLEELYPKWIKKKGLNLARLMYCWAVIRFLRPYTIKKSNLLVFNYLQMYRSYFKIGVRNILKYKLSSFINITGMGVAIGCSIVVYLFVEWFYNRDDFHKNAADIYVVTSVLERDGSEQVWGNSPEVLGSLANNEVTGIDKFSRLDYIGGVMKYDDLVFTERLCFVDPAFLDMFTFPLKYGDKRYALKDKEGIVLSSHIAEKYFGTSNPIDKQITLRIGEDFKGSFLVKGVTEKIPNTASFTFDVLVPYSIQKDLRGDSYESNWITNADATFFMLESAADREVVFNQIDKYKSYKNQNDPEWSVKEFNMIPLQSFASNSVNMRNTIGMGSHPASIILLIVMAGFLLIMACLNYMNISIASASRRLKEIGLRKVIGGYKGQIAQQFLFENFLVCFLSLALGLLLAEFFFIPGFNKIIGIFQFTVDYTSNWQFWLTMLCVLLVTGLAAGSYPAFYISNFQPINIFRGKIQFGSRKIFSRMLLTFQFTLAFLTILLGIVMINNASYLSNLDWGYQKEHTLVVPLEEASQYDLLEGALSSSNIINGMSASKHLVGQRNRIRMVEYENEKHEIFTLGVSDNYLQNLDFNIIEGRHFIKDAVSDKKQAVIINQKMADYFKWDSPINKEFKIDTARLTVVGVVEDFHFLSFYHEMKPALFYIAPEEEINYMTITADRENFAELRTLTASTWKQLFPDLPYDGILQASVFDWVMDDLKRVEKVMTFIAFTALLLTCMGMFGLVSLTVVKRMKEFSIRKVLGANIYNIAKIMNVEFVVMLLIAIAIGTFIGVNTIDGILAYLYKYRVTVGFFTYFTAGVIVVSTAIFTVSSQLYTVAHTKPVDTLKRE